MSGATNNASASSWINQCQTMEELQQAAIIKALRAISGQFKALADTSVTSSTALVTEPEFSFPLKANQKYIVEGYFLISAGAAGGLTLQLNTPANTSGSTFVGKATSAAAGTIATVTLNNNSSLNTPLVSSAAAYDTVYVQGLLSVTSDDRLTVSFAQNTSNGTATTLLRGSSLNLIQLSSARRAPNVV